MTLKGFISHIAVPFTRPDHVITSPVYRTFISFMFAAAMAIWGARLLGLPFGKTGYQGFPDNDLILINGILYGLVLVSFFWIYMARLTIYFLPTNLITIFLDFVALSFMTGAAGSWRIIKYEFIEKSLVIEKFKESSDQILKTCTAAIQNGSSLTGNCQSIIESSPDFEQFNKMAIWTVLLLTLRFIPGAWTERQRAIEGTLQRGDKILTHILWVYAYCFGAVFIPLFFISDAIDIPKIISSTGFNKFLLSGMGIGVGITAWHSWWSKPVSLIPDLDQGPLPQLLSTQLSLPIGNSSLFPAYGVIPEDKLVKVAKNVFLGEKRFQDILNQAFGDSGLPCYFHQSHVHTYRDVETQAFIMAHHASDDNEIQLRSMWVYLTHWFDDIFDHQHPTTLAANGLDGDFDISQVLKSLQPAYEQVWLRAIQETQTHSDWKYDLFNFGFRRLILGGPMFSAMCEGSRQVEMRKAHKQLVHSKLDSASGVYDIFEKLPSGSHYLEYTSKVVVEIWDSFNKLSGFENSMLMDLFYTPGLLLHDVDEESKRGEIIVDKPLGDVNETKKILELVFNNIENLPTEQKRLALAPVPMFVRSFESILEGAKLGEIYDSWK